MTSRLGVIAPPYRKDSNDISSQITLNHTTYVDIVSVYISAGRWRVSCMVVGSNLDTGDCSFRFGGTAGGFYLARETSSLALSQGTTAIGSGDLVVPIDASNINQPWVIECMANVSQSGILTLMAKEVVNNANTYSITQSDIIAMKV